LWRRLARYGGRPEPSTLNVIVESLKLIRESTDYIYKKRCPQRAQTPPRLLHCLGDCGYTLERSVAAPHIK